MTGTQRYLRIFFHGLVLLLLLGATRVAGAAGGAAEPEAKATKPFVPEFEFPAPLPVVVARAAKVGLALEGMESPEGSGSGLMPGDAVTALVSLLNKKELTQWMIEVRCVELNAEEKKKPPLRTWRLYTNTGTEVFLSGTRAVLAVRVVGPFERTSQARDADSRAVEQRARVMVNAEYLSLGLDRACESVFTVNAAKRKDPSLGGLTWSVRAKPFPAEETAAMSQRAMTLGLTPERERALAGANPALREFFNIISQTPGLQDILKSVIDVPWWTIIKRGGDVPIGIMPQFRLTEELPVNSPLVALKNAKTFALPFQLSIAGKSALMGKLVVADPRRPLLGCAGILGVAASAPNGEGPRVMLQVLSARLGRDADQSP